MARRLGKMARVVALLKEEHEARHHGSLARHCGSAAARAQEDLPTDRHREVGMGRKG